MKIQVKKFEDLTTHELYDVLALRTNVFVVEQNCAYEEVDYHDLNALHVLGMEKGKLLAYARIVPPETIYKEPSIGRVAVPKKHRTGGFGRKIFAEALSHTKHIYPNQTIKIQAQVYLEKFYGSFGFKTITEPYPDVGIMHVDMILE